MKNRRGWVPSLVPKATQGHYQTLALEKGLIEEEGTLRMKLAIAMTQTMVRFSIGFGLLRHKMVLEDFKN